MTAAEFKELKPEHKNLEGNQLWDAMENYMLQQQMGSEVLKAIMPIWKTHTLRWLFYRKVPNLIFTNPKTDKWSSSSRCKSCKKGVNFRIMWSCTPESGEQVSTYSCPHCRSEYKAEPNTNLSHKLWKLHKWIINLFWAILNITHLVRSSIDSRYGLFGDESRYVRGWDIGGTVEKAYLKKRKWWEHILIEKPIHNF